MTCDEFKETILVDPSSVPSKVVLAVTLHAMKCPRCNKSLSTLASRESLELSSEEKVACKLLAKQVVNRAAKELGT